MMRFVGLRSVRMPLSNVNDYGECEISMVEAGKAIGMHYGR